MKSKFFGLFLVFVLLLSSVGSVSAQPAKGWGDAGTRIVVMKNGKIPADFQAKVEQAGGTVISTIPQLGAALVSVSAANFESKMMGVKDVEMVVPNITLSVGDPVVQEVVEIDVNNPPFSGDDDFHFELQWGHDAVNAPEAWAMGYYGQGVRVAVMDTGFDTDHPDLAPNINYELSRSFVPGEGLEYAINDSFSHGTHVAGTIAAADNGFGTIGVAPYAELVLLKVLSDEGSGDFFWLLEAIVYAADNEVDVANMSLGALFPLKELTKEEKTEVKELEMLLARAADYANKRGMTLIASAGNDATDLHPSEYKHLPSDAPGFISVAATTPIGWAIDPLNAYLDYPTSYTNYGTQAIDVTAPGGDLLYPGDEVCQVGRVVQYCYVFDLVFSTGSNLNPNIASYYWGGGTSMAAPHVTGVAALIIGKNGGSMKPEKVEAILRQSADDIGPAGRDPFAGFGRVNAETALRK